MWWGAIIVGAAYLLILFKFGRYAFNSNLFGLAGIAMIHASGIQLWYSEMRDGLTGAWFRGNLILYEYGEFTTAGYILMSLSLAIQAGWFWLAFKTALDDEYKARTPAGVLPGAASNVDEFGRAIYTMLHKLLGEPSYQDMDADIARVFGSFDSKVNAMRSQGHIVSSIGIVIAAEIWRQRIARLPIRDKEKLQRWLDAPSSYRLEEMPRIAEQIAVGMRHASEMARFEELTRSEADMFADEVLHYIRAPNETRSFEDRTASRAREFGRDAGNSLMRAVEDFFEGLDRRLKPLYIDTLRKRLEMLPVSRETLDRERMAFAAELRNLPVDTRSEMEQQLGQWFAVANDMGVRDEIDRHVATLYAETGHSFADAAEAVFKRYEAGLASS